MFGSGSTHLIDISHSNGRCDLDEKGTRLGSVLMQHTRHVVGGKVSHISKSAVLCTLTSSGESRVGTGGIVIAELQSSRDEGAGRGCVQATRHYTTDRRNVTLVDNGTIQTEFERRV